MEASALRFAACAAVVFCALVFGGSSLAVPAAADPGDTGSTPTTDKTSKVDNAQRPSLGRVIQRMIREHRDRVRNRINKSPSVKVGSKPDSAFVTTESTVATSGDAGDEADELASTRAAESEESDGGGSSHNANPNEGPDPGEQGGAAPAGQDVGAGGGTQGTTTVAAPPPAKKPQPDGLDLAMPYPYYLIEMRGKGGWWSADRVVATFEELIGAFLPETPEPKIEPTPEPEPVPGPTLRGVAPAPAFRGGVPEPPLSGGPAEPEPILDALGGVVTGGTGSDHPGTGFGAGAVLEAPIIAAPGRHPGAVRFPSVPQAPASAPPAPGAGSGLLAPRATAATEPVATGSAPRAASGGQEQALAGAVTPTAGRTPTRQGYTDYLRAPGLPQLAGAALPGVAWIVTMTYTGAVVGYRQANAGRMVRTSKAARYLP